MTALAVELTLFFYCVFFSRVKRRVFTDNKHTLCRKKHLYFFSLFVVFIEERSGLVFE